MRSCSGGGRSRSPARATRSSTPTAGAASTAASARARPASRGRRSASRWPIHRPPWTRNAEALGGKTVMPVTEIPGLVTFAMFNDPDGLLVGIVKGAGPQEGEPPVPSAGDGAPVDWFESRDRRGADAVVLYGAVRLGAEHRCLFPATLAAAASERGHRRRPRLRCRGALGDDLREHGRCRQTLARAGRRARETQVYAWPMAVRRSDADQALRGPHGNIFGVSPWPGPGG